jgi:arylsulfatase A-like enzyme
VLLVYLESFRHDLLGARVGDREVTPFLNRLAREGGSSARAYVEAPWTLASRKHLFVGSLRLDPGSTTLVDDFKSRGYTVAWFSGQDDSYGDSAHLLGAERADRFYDARQDLDRRTSRSTAPISLQVSWKTLTARALDYIARVDPEQPLFFYLNVVDTHFPYTNDEIDRLLDVESLPRDDINEQNVARVRDTYANTAANVDRAVEIVFDALRWRLGDADLAVVVTSDHGQAFYEYERLGHGQTLDSLETQVPFIVWGLGGDWPEPIGASDVRPLLLEHLGTAGPAPAVRPRFVPDGARRVFQYAPDIEKPRYIALRGRDDSLLYDFARDGAFRIASGDVGGAAAEPRPQRDVRELIWRWEALQRHAIEPEPRTARSARVETDAHGGSPDGAHGG